MADMDLDESAIDLYGLNDTKEVITADNHVNKVVVVASEKGVKYTATDEDIARLYAIFGLMNVDLNKQYLGSWKLNVVHVRGIQHLSSEDILSYFANYDPSSLEWINDVSCNVMFDDPRASATALIGLMTHVVQHKAMAPVNDEGVPVLSGESLETPVPPGVWLLGKEHEKSKAILIRLATHADKKPNQDNGTVPKRQALNRKPVSNGVHKILSDLEMQKMRERLNTRGKPATQLLRMTMKSDQVNGGAAAPVLVTRSSRLSVDGEHDVRAPAVSTSIWARLDRADASAEPLNGRANPVLRSNPVLRTAVRSRLDQGPARSIMSRLNIGGTLRSDKVGGIKSRLDRGRLSSINSRLEPFPNNGDLRKTANRDHSRVVKMKKRGSVFSRLD